MKMNENGKGSIIHKVKNGTVVRMEMCCFGAQQFYATSFAVQLILCVFDVEPRNREYDSYQRLSQHTSFLNRARRCFSHVTLIIHNITSSPWPETKSVLPNRQGN